MDLYIFFLLDINIILRDISHVSMCSFAENDFSVETVSVVLMRKIKNVNDSNAVIMP